jgi:hypothetical protein
MNLHDSSADDADFSVLYPMPIREIRGYKIPVDKAVSILGQKNPGDGTWDI